MQKTYIIDIDGTLTEMWPLEKAVLLDVLPQASSEALETLHSSGLKSLYGLYSRLTKTRIGKRRFFEKYNASLEKLARLGAFPELLFYPLVDWIRQNAHRFRFVYATGGQRLETLYVLERLGLSTIFDFENSVDATNCRFSKKSGIPFVRLKKKFGECELITDSESDCLGAQKVGVGFRLVK